MSGSLATYGFLSAKLKTRLSKTISQDRINALIRAASLPEAVHMLRGTPYEIIDEVYAATGDIRAAEAKIHEYELELYTGLYRYLKEPLLRFVQALSLHYGIERVKETVRLWFDAHIRGRNVDGKSGYLYGKKIVYAFNVDEVICAPDTDALVKALGDTPYAAIAKRYMPNAAAERSLFEFELALDEFFYKETFEAAALLKPADRRVAERILGVSVDIQNISRIARLKGFSGITKDKALSHIIPGGKAIHRSALHDVWQSDSTGGAMGIDILGKYYGALNTLAVTASSGSGGAQADAAAKLAFLETALRAIMSREADVCLAGNPFSIGVVLAYFTRKREELRTITTILNAKNYSLPEERIRSFL